MSRASACANNRLSSFSTVSNRASLLRTDTPFNSIGGKVSSTGDGSSAVWPAKVPKSLASFSANATGLVCASPAV